MIVARCPRTGVHLREATELESRAWRDQPARLPAFRAAVRVGDVVVDEWTGPGASHVPGRFL